MARRARRLGMCAVPLALAVGAAAIVLPGDPAQAFKPYTHIKTSESAYNDVVADGKVTIDNKEYVVDPKLVAALRSWKSYYNAGVIGPDGFPDLIMGQSVIHPKDTGKWLRHLLMRAWQAQDNISEPGAPYSDPSRDPDYNDAEEGQILAFTYGFLTHAAGDTWAHTLINEMSGDVFPEVGDMGTDKTAREIALRHILLEGYIGAATQGFDNNPEESVLANGDVAGDATLGIPFDAPIRFVFDTMVSQNSSYPAPSEERGKVIELFQGLRASLAAWVEDDPSPINDLINAYNSFANKWKQERRPARCNGRDDDGDGRVDEGCLWWEIADFNSPSKDEGASGNCNFGEGYSGGFIAVDLLRDIPACAVVMGFSAIWDSVTGVVNAVTDTALLLGKQILNAYVREWIKDIDDGLEHWGELGLAITRGLFDPQTRRDAQNDICRNYGADIVTTTPAKNETNARRKCENGVSAMDTVFWAADDFINDHLLPMVGLPDWIGSIRSALSDFGDVVSDGLSAVLGDLYPTVAEAISGITSPIKNLVKDTIKNEVSERFGIPVDDIAAFLEEPVTRIDTEYIDTPPRTYKVLWLIPITIPGQRLMILGPTYRAKLDGYLGLQPHALGAPFAPGERFNVNSFKAYRNASNMAKMLLLDGPTMDRFIGDEIGGSYSLYGNTVSRKNELTVLCRRLCPGGNPQPEVPIPVELPTDLLDRVSNVMTTTMPDAGGPPDQWLRMIDGDHAWREDGLPVFDDPDHLKAGEGNFPLWESCRLRKRVFRKIFKDWENDLPARGGDGDGILDANENFPDLGDYPTDDPAAPPPPSTMLNVGFPHRVVDGQIYVTPATQLSVSVLAPQSGASVSGLGAQWRIGDGAFSNVASGRSFRLGNTGLGDTDVELEYTTEDDCGASNRTSTWVRVDATPPSIYFNYFDGMEFDTSSTPMFYYGTYDDGVGPDPGVTRFIIDGRVIPNASQIEQNGYQIDTSRMAAGNHTLQVVARDLLGNTGTKTLTFKVVASLDSLIENLTKALETKRIYNQETFDYLLGLINSAQQAHYIGKHLAEWKILRKLIAQLEVQRGVTIDFGTAGRLASYAESIITGESSPTQQFAPGVSRRAGSRA